MTFLWVLCGWTLMGVPLGMAVGGALARKNAEVSHGAEMLVYTETAVCL